MIHALLQRQVRKFLPEGIPKEGWQDFLAAIDRSYQNFDEKLTMLQRATALSSEELYLANLAIEKEALRQKGILVALENAIFSLKMNLGDTELKLSESGVLSPENLAAKIMALAEELRRMSQERNQMVKELEIQNTALNNYAHMVSHDLKSPMRNINALMDWIKEDEREKLSEESLHNHGLISQNLERMDHLIDGILRHATMGTIKETKVKVDLGATLTDIENTIFVPPNIQIKKQAGLPTLYMPKNTVEQLFTNLLTNAITATEHNPDGHIFIGHGSQGNFWKFSVTDNGKGIAQRHQESIFEMFRKLENDTNSIGVGLALVKKIINLYEGEIWIESTEGKGTTFHFTLKKENT